MGRKKITITRIQDERNRQVRVRGRGGGGGERERERCIAMVYMYVYVLIHVHVNDIRIYPTMHSDVMHKLPKFMYNTFLNLNIVQKQGTECCLHLTLDNADDPHELTFPTHVHRHVCRLPSASARPAC